LIEAEPRDEVLLLTNQGRGWTGGVGFVPADGDGLGLSNGEHVVSITVSDPDQYLLLGTREGQVKRIAVAELSLVDRQWGPLIGLDDGDELLFGAVAGEDAHVVFYTAEGQLLRLDGDEIRPQKTDTAGGVIGISLKSGDYILGGMVVPNGATEENEYQVVVVSETGYANRVPLADFSVQGRNTQGVQCLRETKSGGKLGGVAVGKEDDELDVHLDDDRRFHGDVDALASMTRGSRGERLFEADDAGIERVVVL
jgi:DNA gyrase subunit A